MVNPLTPYAPTAKAVLLGSGVVGALYIMKQSPELEDEDKDNLLKATIGIVGFVAVAIGVCSFTKWDICASVPKLPVKW